MQTKKAFGEYILQKRRELNLTQKELAASVFVSESAVSKWERGLSYPDITLIQPLCKTLHVTEHELLTASRDSNYHTLESLSSNYQKIKKRYQWILALLLGISLMTVFIVNLVTKHTLSYFFIVFFSELLFSSLFLFPTFFEKNKKLIALFSFTISLLILLFTINLYVQGNWFFLVSLSALLGLSLCFLPMVLQYLPFPEEYAKYRTLLYFIVNTLLLIGVVSLATPFSYWGKALMITGSSLVLPWSIMLILCYTPLNRNLKISLCFGISGIFLYYINGFIGWVLGETSYFSGISLQSLAFSHRDRLNFMFVVLLFIGMLAFLLKYFCLDVKRGQNEK